MRDALSSYTDKNGKALTNIEVSIKDGKI